MLSIRELHCSKKALLTLSELSFLSVSIGTFCMDNLSFTNTFWINKDGYYLDKLVLGSLCVSANRVSNRPHFCTSVYSEFGFYNILHFKGKSFGIVDRFKPLVHVLLVKHC